MSVAVDIRNPVDLSRAGWSALNAKLGYDVAQAFMNLKFAGSGDFTKERNERPQMSFEEISARLTAAEAKYFAREE